MTPAQQHSAEVILRHTEGEDHAAIVARAVLRQATRDEALLALADEIDSPEGLAGPTPHGWARRIRELAR